MVRILHLWTEIPHFNIVNVGTTDDITVGIGFTSTVSGIFHGFRWWRSPLMPMESPTHVGVFDLTTNELVSEAEDVLDDHQPGWQISPHVGAFVIQPDHDYVVAARFLAGSVFTAKLHAAFTPPALPTITIPANPTYTTTEDWPAMPTQVVGADVPLIDMNATGIELQSTFVTVGAMDLVLDDWFARNTAAQTFTRPAYIPALLEKIDDTTASTADDVTFIAGGGGTSTEVIDYLNNNLGTTAEWAASAHPKLVTWLAALLAVLADALTTLAFLHDLFPSGHTPTDHDASLAAHRAATEPDGETLPSYIEGEIEIVLSAVTDQTNEITQILAHGNGTEDVPTIVGESDWSNIFRFDVAADFYVVDITTTDIDAVVEDVAGTSVWDHLGFCIPLTVDGLPEYGPRLAIGGQVIRTGRQMGGIILNGRRVLSGHVTAYQYQAP